MKMKGSGVTARKTAVLNKIESTMKKECYEEIIS